MVKVGFIFAPNTLVSLLLILFEEEIAGVSNPKGQDGFYSVRYDSFVELERPTQTIFIGSDFEWSPVRDTIWEVCVIE